MAVIPAFKCRFLKMIKKIAFGSGVVAIILVGGILVVAATKPDEFRVERSVQVNATSDKILPLISDLHQGVQWSPFEKTDPQMKRSYSGAPSGAGAVYEWSGNQDAGQGRMEITEATPNKVTMQLDFIKPFEARNTAEFRLEPSGDTTKLTWAMYGPNPYLCKVMQTFCNIDSMIGKDFESGLANIKLIAERKSSG